MNAAHEDLNLKLEIYEGPLELLLHLIKRNEVDIHDIPVSLITAQYLEYIEYIESINLDLAGDFLVMAATLAHIKSKMLLPADSLEAGEQPEDPRLELVRPLLEYSAFQTAAENVSMRPQLNRDVFVRGGVGSETLDLPEDNQPESLMVAKSSVYELVKAWQDLYARRTAEGLSLKFSMETVTIGEKLVQIRAFLLSVKSAHFRDLAGLDKNNYELALNFLAVLELARTGFLRLYQDSDVDQSGPRLFLADPAAREAPEKLDYR
ncbi:MAG: segregation/condensation protein A [Deltaproteobacteria bacterium]|jgi:segregation and condensation protein A|nr:segregation/condensation protein A [Deltaproteobacteria bacterium]